MDLVRRAVEDRFLLLRGQLPEGNIGPDPFFSGNVLHKGPHQGLPGEHSPLFDGQGLIRHQGRLVNHPDNAGAVAAFAGPGAVEGQLFGTGGHKVDAALRAYQLQPGGYIHAGCQVVPIGAAVAGQPGEHEPQYVEQLRRGAEGAADAGDPRPLVQSQGRGNIAQVLHLGLFRLGHSPAGVGGQGLQVSPGALGVEHPQGQAGFAGAGDPGNAYDFVQGNVYINVFQIVDPGSTDLNGLRNGLECICHEKTS